MRVLVSFFFHSQDRIQIDWLIVIDCQLVTRRIRLGWRWQQGQPENEASLSIRLWICANSLQSRYHQSYTDSYNLCSSCSSSRNGGSCTLRRPRTDCVRHRSGLQSNIVRCQHKCSSLPELHELSNLVFRSTRRAAHIVGRILSSCTGIRCTSLRPFAALDRVPSTLISI